MTTAPSLQPPGPISVMAGDEQLILRWTPSPSPEVVAYRIYRRNPDGTWPAQPMEGTTHTEYADLEVQNGVSYSYRIAAVDAQGNMSMAQEATGAPVGSASSGSSAGMIAKKTAILAGVLILLAGGVGGYVYGKSQGESAGEKSGESAGYKQGYDKGSADVQAQYAPGASGYKRIYDKGYSEGQKKGKATGKAQGERKGEEIGYEQGKASGEKSGQKSGEVKGEEAAYTLALGGYTAWQPGLPYLVNVKSTNNKAVPYGVNVRHMMESGYDYYLCSSGEYGVCRSKTDK